MANTKLIELSKRFSLYSADTLVGIQLTIKPEHPSIGYVIGLTRDMFDRLPEEIDTLDEFVHVLRTIGITLPVNLDLVISLTSRPHPPYVSELMFACHLTPDVLIQTLSMLSLYSELSPTAN
jgi:hypothetical protein